MEMMETEISSEMRQCSEDDEYTFEAIYLQAVY